ncbi:MAG: 4-hydroxy-tetrahydrodipicolinate synthase [Candidatus Bathyarchaeia archaeon]
MGVVVRLFSGCYTALITPMKRNFKVDYESLKQLVQFQLENGVAGIVAVGTTGESPTLSWQEHNTVIERIYEYADGMGETIAGTGSNCTDETLKATDHAVKCGIESFLLVDPYYNGPSSLEIRREYIEPLARRFPQIKIIPYIIPGRTGTQLLPQDLAILHSKFPGVGAVKEATGDLENTKLIRSLCGPDFDILSGDDDKTYELMSSSAIRASGVISVASNIAPAAIVEFVKALRGGDIVSAKKLDEALRPLFQIVTVKTEENPPIGPKVLYKARNPLPYKTLMNILGMPSGPCRPPLGKMTKNSLEFMLNQVRKVYTNNPEILRPVESFFEVDLGERLYDERYLEGLYYEEY